MQDVVGNKEEIDYFAGAPLGKLVYDRTYSRVKEDGSKETWPETVARVVNGNCNFIDSQFIEEGEREELYNLIVNRKMIPAGRHLWVTGIEGRAFVQNCHVAGFDAGFAEHAGFHFNELMKGGGVGANFSSKYLKPLSPPVSRVDVRFVCDTEHKDFEVLQPLLEGDILSDFEETGINFQIPDSREGWVEALELLIKNTKVNNSSPAKLTFDVSLVRPYGDPIKGFGGTASGPLPLIVMLKKVAQRLYEHVSADYPIGEIAPPLAMDIDHFIAEAVIAGNVRRSARMSIMHWNDPWIFWFLKCKDDYTNHWSTNISVEIDDDFFYSLNHGELHATTVYEAVLDGMLKNGEPGFYNSSMASKGENVHIAATNPCISPDTWTLTGNGPCKVGDLVGTPVSLVVDSKLIQTQSEGFFQTGVKDTIKISFKHWKTPLICTPNQKLHTPDGWVEADTLILGSKLRLQDHAGITWEGKGSEDDGYLLGHLVGDGTYKHQYNGTFLARLEVWEKDGDTSFIRSEVDRIMTFAKTRSDFKGWRPVRGGKGWTMSTSHITSLAEEYGITHGNKGVTEGIETSSSQFYVGFLRGLFDTDGHVEISKSAISIRLSSSNPQSLAGVQRMLGRLGVLSRIHLSRKAAYRSLPDGKGGYKEYWCKDSYRLIIQSIYAHRFMEVIGFWATDKSNKFYDLTQGISPVYRQMWAEIESIEPHETMAVYDCTLEGLIFDGNGLDIFDCGEQPMEPWESCNLGHVNLTFGSDDDHRRAFRLMARFLVRATFCDIQDPKQLEVVRRNRRIGVGFFGLQEWLAMRGIPYSQFDRHGILADNLVTWYDAVRTEADSYADELGIPHPVKVTTLAPTGSIAKLAGTSESAQAIYAKYYIRRVRYSEQDPEVPKLRERGVPLEPCIYTPGTLVASFPCRDSILDRVPEHYIEEQGELDPATVLALQAYLQRYYVDNAISMTVNIKPLDGIQDWVHRSNLDRALRKYLPHIKGATVFPEASRPQAPITKITETEYLRLQAQIKPATINAGTSEILENECVGACPIR